MTPGVNDFGVQRCENICADGCDFPTVEEQAAIFNLFSDNWKNMRVSDEQHACFNLSFHSMGRRYRPDLKIGEIRTGCLLILV